MLKLLLALVCATAMSASADMTLDNIPEDRHYEIMVIEIVEDSDKEVCITLGGTPEVHCFLKPNPPVSSIKM